jgi:bisanhydrobacterioruberin hydratase
MKRKKIPSEPGIVLIIVLFLLETIGINSDLSLWSISMIPFYFLLNALVLLLYEKYLFSSLSIYLTVMLVFLFLVEALNVYIKFPLGGFQFGDTLGGQLLGVPLILPLFWLTLIYSSIHFLKTIHFSNEMRALLGATFLTLADFFLEMVAEKYNFWKWHANIVSWGNYISWFTFSYVFIYLFFRFKFRSRNRLAVIVFIALLVFILANAF